MPGDLDNLNMKWYVPDEESVWFVKNLAQTFLAPQLEFVSSLTPSTEISKYVCGQGSCCFIYSFVSLLCVCVYLAI